MFNVLHLGKYVPMLLFFKDLWLEFILTYKELVTFFRADAVTCNYVNYSHGLKKLPHKTIVLWVVYDCLIHQLKLYLKKKKKTHNNHLPVFSASFPASHQWFQQVNKIKGRNYRSIPTEENHFNLLRRHFSFMRAGKSKGTLSPYLKFMYLFYFFVLS